MNVKDVSEINETYWGTTPEGEPVLRFKKSIWFTFESACPQPKGDGAKGILEWKDKPRKRNKK